GGLERLGAALERIGCRNEPLEPQLPEHPPGERQPARPVPSAAQRGIQGAHLARDDAQPVAMEAPAEIDWPRARAVPRADDDAPAEADGLDRTVERTHVARELEREIRAAHAVEQGPPGAGV